MRTVILLGLSWIAGAINNSYFESIPEETQEFVGIVLFIAIIMDIVDFLSSKGK